MATEKHGIPVPHSALAPGLDGESGPRWEAALAAAKKADFTLLNSLLPQVYAYLREVAGSSVRPEWRREILVPDLVQDAPVKAFAALGSFHGTTKAQFLAFLRPIVKHVACDAIRKLLATKRGAHAVHFEPEERLFNVPDFREARGIKQADDKKRCDDLVNLSVEMFKAGLLTEDDMLMVLWWRLRCPLVAIARAWQTDVPGIRKHRRRVFNILRKKARQRGLGPG